MMALYCILSTSDYSIPLQYNVTNIWSVSVCYLFETQLIWVFVMFIAFVKPIIMCMFRMFIKYLSICFMNEHHVRLEKSITWTFYDLTIMIIAIHSCPKRWTNSAFQPIDVYVSTACRYSHANKQCSVGEDVVVVVVIVVILREIAKYDVPSSSFEWFGSSKPQIAAHRHIWNGNKPMR